MSVAIGLDLRPRLGPVRDQGARPTCLAHATTTAHEYARGSTVALSPEYLHYFASRERNSSEGVDFSTMSQVLQSTGQPVETDCPYHVNDPPSGWGPAADLPLYRRQSTSSERGPDKVEALLVAGHAPILGIATTDAFYSPAPPLVISSAGPVRGLHAVVAAGVGKTRTTRCFLIRNSWGGAWADEGHAWVDDAFIIQHLHEVLVLTKEMSSWLS